MLDYLKNLIFSARRPGAALAPVERMVLDPDTVIEDCLKALSCQDGGLGLFRLVHLLDAVSSLSNPPERILSIGSGKGYHEVVLAHLYPQASIVAIDIEKQSHAHQAANLAAIQGDILHGAFLSDIEAADFVYSIECLEHIQRDAEAFLAMVGLVRQGGSFYLQVPYATDWERNDAETVKKEFQDFGHFTPGYDVGQLLTLANNASLEVSKVGNVFWTPLQPMLWAAVDKFGPSIIHRYTRELVELLMTDFRDELATHRGQSTGIKLLARKPGAVRAQA